MDFLNKLKNSNYQRLILILAVFYALFKLISFTKGIIGYISITASDIENPLKIWELYLVDWFVVVFFMSAVALLTTQNIFNGKINWIKLILTHVMSSFLFGIAIVFSSHFVLKQIGKLPFADGSLSSLMNRVLMSFDLNFLIYLSMLSIIYIYYYVKVFRTSQDYKSKLEISLTEAKLIALKAQLHPHFIFNILNSISALIESSADKALVAIHTLSSYLRKSFKDETDNFSTLEKELFFLDDFLSLVKTRFNEDVFVEKKVQPDIGPLLIPTFVLQPIIENSLKHGFSENHLKLAIQIEIFLKANYVHIYIENNGKLMYTRLSNTKNSDVGTGLANIRQRLKIIYGDDHFFSIKNKKDYSGVITKIIVPKMMDHRDYSSIVSIEE